MGKGWEVFGVNLLWYGSQANPKPLVFAMMTNGELIIHIAHGFE